MPARSQPNSHENRRQSRRRILVIDDDVATLQIIQKILEKGGYEVASASGGNEGLRSFRSTRFDLVLVDMVMPEMDGFETTSLMHRLCPEVKIIAMSGAPNAKSANGLELALKLGAVRALPKPFAPNELLSVVGECVAS
jgi:CheY-like chemotaxis protein